MTADFSDPSFRGEGRRRPPGRPNPLVPNTSIPDLNYAKGTKVRVVQDNGSRGLVGLVGTVVESIPGSVVVELENDPALRHRVRMAGGFETPRVQPKRHFRVTEVERVLDPRAQ